MKGSLATKLGRIAAALAQRPDHLVKYLGSQSSAPLKLGLPWISYAGIEFLEKYLTRQMLVFEFGSGGSTIFFAERVASVVAVEENSDWIEAVKQELGKRRLENVEIRASNWDSSLGPAGFENSDYVDMLQDSYDVIMVDGMCFWPDYSLRPLCFEQARHHLKPNGIVILDDSWRYDEALSGSGYSRRRVFKSLGPCRPGVTSTTVYWFD